MEPELAQIVETLKGIVKKQVRRMSTDKFVLCACVVCPVRMCVGMR